MRYKGILWFLGALLITNGCASVSVASCGKSSTEICGFSNPEDIAVVAQPLEAAPAVVGLNTARPFLVTVNAVRGPASDWFGVIDTLNGAKTTLPWRQSAMASTTAQTRLGVADCAAPSARRPRGFDVRPLPDGGWLLAVITDDTAGGGRAAQRIDYVELARDAAGWIAQWAGCVPVPGQYFLNDVAIGPRGELFATHMYTRDDGWPDFVRRVKFFFGVATGSAVMWDGDKGWRAVPNTGGSFPNGIAVDPTGSVLFVAYTYNSNLARVDLLNSTRTDIALALRPDNLTWAKDDVTKADMLVVAGGTGLRMIRTWNCEKQKPACIFPFAVAAVNSTSSDVQTLYATDRQAIPGASVAVKVGQTLYLGTAFGDRITVVPLTH